MRIVTLLCLLVLLPLPAGATTITKTFSYVFSDGIYSGETLRLQYSYPALPEGQSIFSYSPDVDAVATIAGGTSVASDVDAIFSDSGDILQPEFFSTFTFEPGDNALGVVQAFQFSAPFALQRVDGEDLDRFTCNNPGVRCFEATAAVPLPSSGALLLTASILAGGLGLRRKRGWRRSSGVRRPLTKMLV